MNLTILIVLFAMLCNYSFAFRAKSFSALRTFARNMGQITEVHFFAYSSLPFAINYSFSPNLKGVEFDTIAREWRFKWSGDDEKKSLASAQQTLSLFAPALKNVDGLKNVQRIVCGGCLDFKVIVAVSADKFGAWVSKAEFFIYVL